MVVVVVVGVVARVVAAAAKVAAAARHTPQSAKAPYRQVFCSLLIGPFGESRPAALSTIAMWYVLYVEMDMHGQGGLVEATAVATGELEPPEVAMSGIEERCSQAMAGATSRPRGLAGGRVCTGALRWRVLMQATAPHPIVRCTSWPGRGTSQQRAPRARGRGAVPLMAEIWLSRPPSVLVGGSSGYWASCAMYCRLCLGCRYCCRRW